MSNVLIICKTPSLGMLILICLLLIAMIMIGNVSYDLENLFKPHDEYDIDNNVCNNIEGGFGRVSTLGINDPTTLENDKSYDFFIKVGLERSSLYLMIIPLFWKSVNFACMRIIKRKIYMIVILMNLIMILHIIIMREENMVVEIFMLLNYLSLC